MYSTCSSESDYCTVYILYSTTRNQTFLLLPMRFVLNFYFIKRITDSALTSTSRSNKRIFSENPQLTKTARSKGLCWQHSKVICWYAIRLCCRPLLTFTGTFTIQDQFCINFFSRLAFQNIFKCLFLLHCIAFSFTRVSGILYSVSSKKYMHYTFIKAMLSTVWS